MHVVNQHLVRTFAIPFFLIFTINCSPRLLSEPSPSSRVHEPDKGVTVLDDTLRHSIKKSDPTPSAPMRKPLPSASERLLEAVKQHDELLSQTLIKQGANVNYQSRGDSLLMRAVGDGHEPIVRLLIEQGADIGRPNDFGFTPLTIASQYGHERIVRLLIEKGADVTHQSNTGWTALIIAAAHGRDNVVNLLTQSGASVNTNTADHLTAIIIAAQRGHETTVRRLLQLGAEVSPKNIKGPTAIQMASQNGHEGIVQLLQPYVDPNLDIIALAHEDIANLLWLMYRGDFDGLRHQVRKDLQRVSRQNLVFGLMDKALGMSEWARYDGLLAQYILVKTQTVGVCGQPTSTIEVTSVTKWVNGLGVTVKEEINEGGKYLFMVPRPFGEIVVAAQKTKPTPKYGLSLANMIVKAGGCTSDLLQRLEANMVKYFES